MNNLPSARLPPAAALLRTLLLAAVLCAMLAIPATAIPSGASVTYVTNSTAGLGIAGNRTDPRSTITTIDLDALQQDQHWKGYVGNVSGKLSLDDANGKTIYDWSLTGATMTGEVYATRNGSVTFASVACAIAGTVNVEDSFHNMTGGLPDSINRTFNGTTHKPFYVGDTLLANCSSIATYVNDAPQTLDANAAFPEILIQDNAANLIYVALIDDNAVGFDSTTYDFQMIVAESGVKASPTTYYFFTELG